jgi:hypothetical protein
VGKEETLKIKNNWIYDNGEYTNADGILISYSYAASQIRNNTIVENGRYGINLFYSENVNISNCIIWDNISEQIYLYPENIDLDVTYCCIQDGYYGEGNIDTDPLFWDEDISDYHLTWESGCVDRGYPYGDYDDENDIDGNPRVAGDRVDIGGDEDFPHCPPIPKDKYYKDWDTLGRPNCWLEPFQCDGDADNAVQGLPKYRVYTNDYNIMVANWKKKIGDSNFNPCADFDRLPQGLPKYRVYTNDFNILVGNWKKTDDDLPANCVKCERLQQSQEKTLNSQEIMKWFEQIWLDEEVQKLIDKDVLLKFIESLKEEL